MSASTTWTDDRVQTLARLWREGASASQIARRLGGVTRNAVIGKVHRLGLSGHATARSPGGRRIKPERAPRLRIAKAPPRVCRKPAPAPLAEAPTTGLATTVSVRRGDCRWPIGDPLQDDFRLCGRPSTRGAYCASHGALAYRPTDRDHLLKLARLV